MPEQTQPDEIIMQMKCAHCFKVIEKMLTREFCFCSDECFAKGVTYKKEHRRQQALDSYHRNKTIKVYGRGRPRKDGTNLI